MTDHWTFYLGNINDCLSSIYFNMGLGQEAPISSKPWLLWAWVHMKSPRPDGLSSSEEAPELFKIEDALVAEAGKKCGALLSGRITTLGRREFYLYGESDAEFPSAVRESLALFEGYQFDFGLQKDAEWKQYFDVLYSSPEQIQCIGNREVLDALGRQGDIHSVPRPVDHWVYFPSPDLRAQFSSRVEEKEFQTSFLDQSEGTCPFGLMITRTQSIEQSAIDQTVLELCRLAQEFQGDYDGWGTKAQSPE